ncbi:TPA: hypothetical protein HA246_03070 [Candidatus Woesearchaeota archaeon]|nr:hypothetical protein [Candidatus Woesearchaeota archaeon]
MTNTHRIQIWTTKQFKEDVIKTAAKLNYHSVCDFVRDVLSEKMYKMDRMDKLLWILDKDERDKNTKMADEA